MKAIIPAAGWGTRFLPATKVVPKPLLPIVDQPMIAFAIDEARSAGLTEIDVVVSAGDELLERYFEPAPALEAALREQGKDALLDAIASVDVNIVVQSEPAGLGDAVLRCRDDETCAVLLPDEIFADADLLRALIRTHRNHGGAVVAVMEMAPEEIQYYGSVDPEPVDEHVVGINDFVEKPPIGTEPSNLGSIGRYIITPEVFAALGEAERSVGGEIQLTDAIARVARDGIAHAYIHRGPRWDVGTPAGMVRATIDHALARDDIGPELRAYIESITKD